MKMQGDKNLMRLWVDFNDMEEEDRIWADLDQASFFFEEDIYLGNRARLFDGVGHECAGYIVEIDTPRRLIELEIDWQTWRANRPPIDRLYTSSVVHGASVRGRDLELAV